MNIRKLEMKSANLSRRLLRTTFPQIRNLFDIKFLANLVKYEIYGHV